MANWLVVVNTENVDHAGTDANVFLNLHGKNNNGMEVHTSDIFLDNPAPVDDFERNRTDSFFVNVPEDMAQLEWAEIRHDNSGGHPGWKLGWISLFNLATGGKWHADIHQWLALDEGDHRIARGFAVQPIVG